jgi:hypothetical protein
MTPTAIGSPPPKSRQIETSMPYFFLTKLPFYRVVRKETCRDQTLLCIIRVV